VNTFDVEYGKREDPPNAFAAPEENAHCARCGHRYQSHGGQGCDHSAAGRACKCKAFRKPAK
jgi:hypothetical protein